MYSIKKLASISWDGLDDMLPAVREAMADADGIQCLEPVYGPAPRTTIIALALLALAAGFWFEAKTEKDKLRPAQIAFKAACAEAGVAVVVGRVGNVAEHLGYTDGRKAA